MWLLIPNGTLTMIFARFLRLQIPTEPQKKDSVLVRCRPDCAWYDTKDRRCVMMSLKVYLQSVDSVLNPEESKPTVAVELN